MKSMFPLKSKTPILCLLILVPGIIFGSTLSYDFVWDDRYCHLHHNPHLQNISWSSLIDLWTSSYVGMYIPVTYTFWALVKLLSGNAFSPNIFHGINVVFHIFNGLLVFGILTRFVKSDGAACAGAFLFLLHPLQVESVAWVSEFRGLFSSFWALIAMWQYLVFREKKKIVYYVVALVAFALSALAKPSAVVLPLLVGILDIGVLKNSWCNSLKILAPWLVVSGILAIVTKLAQPDAQIDFIAPIALRPLIVCDTFLFYLGKLLFPFSLSALYGRTPDVVMEQWYFFLLWVPVGIVLGILWRVRNRFPLFLISFVFWALSFLPVSGLVSFAFQNQSTIADRYLYLGMLGVSLFFAQVIAIYLKGKVRVLVPVFLILCWGGISFSRLPVWKSDLTLWSDVLEKYPKDSFAHYNLGFTWEQKGELAKAMLYYEKALEYDSFLAPAHHNLAKLWAQKGEISKALYHYELALKIDPKYTNAYINLGNLFTRQGQMEQARSYYKQALALEPNHPMAHNNLGYTYEQEKDFSPAIQHYKQALIIRPQQPITHYNLGNIFADQGKIAEAKKHFGQAIKLHPNYAQAYHNLGIIFHEEGKIAEAINLYEKALQIKPDYASAHSNLAQGFFSLGKRKKATFHAQKALQLEPKNEVLRKSLQPIFDSN